MTGFQVLEQEDEEFLQTQSFSVSHLASFQPSPVNSAQSSSPTLLGSPWFQYVRLQIQPHCEPQPSPGPVPAPGRLVLSLAPALHAYGRRGLWTPSSDLPGSPDLDLTLVAP